MTRRKRALRGCPRALAFDCRAMFCRLRSALKGYTLTQLLCQRQAWDGDQMLEALIDEEIESRPALPQ